jgi:SAM-dependent MidA family methyltransferase
VGKRLAEYYAQPSNKVIGSAPSIRLSSLLGEWHWRRVYRRLYKEQEGQWLTPVELFRPHYSNILANFVAETSVSDRVHIVELGGGLGTNADLILSQLQRTEPKLYDQVSYTIIDSSQPLMELQKKILGSGQHAAKVDFVFQDLMQVAEEK